MTFGVSYMLGIDLQQVSVATLIIALGLLVDVPVVRAMALSAALRWPASCHRGMAGSDQAGDGNLFRNADEHHRLPAFPFAHGEHREFLRSLPS